MSIVMKIITVWPFRYIYICTEATNEGVLSVIQPPILASAGPSLSHKVFIAS
jgi:hypothetical protein